MFSVQPLYHLLRTFNSRKLGPIAVRADRIKILQFPLAWLLSRLLGLLPNSIQRRAVPVWLTRNLG
ncbi:hypothetical protein AB1L88_16600, partial [Tautonia sp. JC769]|uniref:hypothetical protein n=1 Tax=Tautonia sp. JC769 TaxID=3232135 RepID=UPI00345A5701